MSSVIRGDDSFDSDIIPGLIKTVSNHNISAFSQSLTATVKADITGIDAVITPISTSSKILILAQWCGEVSTGPENVLLGIDRNGTSIGNPAAAGNRGIGIFPIKINYHNNAASTMESCQFHYLDSPASTSELTYSLTVLSQNASITLYTNRTVTDSNTQAYERGSTSIILMEILL